MSCCDSSHRFAQLATPQADRGKCVPWCADFLLVQRLYLQTTLVHKALLLRLQQFLATLNRTLVLICCRYEAERGPGRVSIFTRLAINCLGDHGPDELAATVEAAVDKSRRNILGPEGVAAGASLDLVQLHWLDYKVREVESQPSLLQMFCVDAEP